MIQVAGGEEASCLFFAPSLLLLHALVVSLLRSTDPQSSLSLLLFSSGDDAKKLTHEQSEMPSQKQATLSSSSPSAGSENSSPVASAAADLPDENPNSAAGDEANSPSHSTPPQEQDDSDGEGGSSSTSSQSSDEQEEYVLVKLMDIRKEVQCPICLGIIRKTRTVMECLHRFCRECIDKSMRLGNNECPACRTHCASRRSLRDDPNFDALIAALYPDIDKYEEEELAFHEEEKNRYKKIQASIAETFRRQSEALGKRRLPKSSTESFRRSDCSYRTGQRQNGYFRGRGKTAARNASPMVSDDDEEEEYANGNDAGKDSSSAEEASPDRRPKRSRLMAAPRSSPARIAGNADLGYGENCDFDMNRETFRTSPLRAGKRELSWGKGGARSQTRHGNNSGSNGRFVKAARVAKLMEYLRNLDENENELLPLNEHGMKLDSRYICCPPAISIKHICQFIAIQTSAQVEGGYSICQKASNCTR